MVVVVCRRTDAGALAGRAIVIVADPDADGLAVAAAARAARVPVNVVDRPELSTFIMPAIIDRDPLLINALPDLNSHSSTQPATVSTASPGPTVLR